MLCLQAGGAKANVLPENYFLNLLKIIYRKNNLDKLSKQPWSPATQSGCRMWVASAKLDTEKVTPSTQRASGRWLSWGGPGPAPSAPSRDLLEMETSGTRLRSSEPEMLGWGQAMWVATIPSGECHTCSGVRFTDLGHLGVSLRMCWDVWARRPPQPTND